MDNKLKLEILNLFIKVLDNTRCLNDRTAINIDILIYNINSEIGKLKYSPVDDIAEWHDGS